MNKVVTMSAEVMLGAVLAALVFMIAEPAIMLSATQSTFTISQTVSSEISFSTPASNVVLQPSIGGLTGGTSNGGTQVVVLTNSHLGYQMTLNASSSLGMIGIASSSNYIPALVPATTGVPDYNLSAGTVPANRAAFGYTVEASSTTDLAAIFRDNGAACNAGAGDTTDQCWLNASTTNVTIVNRTLQTPGSGATTTLKFRVVIRPNPSPIIPDDTYVATTTLTATAN